MAASRGDLRGDRRRGPSAVVLARVGLVRCMIDDSEDGAELVEATSYLLAHGDTEQKLAALNLLASLRLAQSRPDAALTAWTRPPVTPPTVATRCCLPMSRRGG